MKRFFLLFFLFTTSYCWAQTLHYDIFYKGWDVGDLVSKISTNGNDMDIEVVSHVVAKVIVTVQVKYVMKCKYRNNELLNSSVITYLNGNIRSSMKVYKKEGYYLVDEDGETRKFYGKITCSDALLNTREPKNLPVVFSEFDAINKPVIKTGDNLYRLTNPKNNNYTDFVYSNGILQKSIIHYTLATFEIRIK